VLAAIPRERRRTVDVLVEISRTLASRIAYIVRMEPGVWSSEETLANAKGSCRDTGWLLVRSRARIAWVGASVRTAAITPSACTPSPAQRG
jgi:hypothetical protein